MTSKSKPVQWTLRELELRARLEAGQTVVVNVRKTKGDARLTAWARERGLLVYIGHRGPWHPCPQSAWANPFRFRKDCTLDEICDLHAALQQRLDLLAMIGELKGKALGC